MGKNLVYQLPAFWREDKIETWECEGTILDAIKLLVWNLRDTGFDFHIDCENYILTVSDPELNNESDFDPDNFLKMMHWTRVFYVIGNYEFQPRIHFVEFIVELFWSKRIFLQQEEFPEVYQFFTDYGQLDEAIRLLLSPSIGWDEIQFLNSLNPSEIQVVFSEEDDYPSMFVRPNNMREVKFDFNFDSLHF